MLKTVAGPPRTLRQGEQRFQHMTLEDESGDKSETPINHSIPLLKTIWNVLSFLLFYVS